MFACISGDLFTTPVRERAQLGSPAALRRDLADGSARVVLSSTHTNRPGLKCFQRFVERADFADLATQPAMGNRIPEQIGTEARDHTAGLS